MRPRRPIVSILAFGAVQACTGARIGLAGAAILAAQAGRLQMAATLITLGIVTDGCDGVLARRLQAESEFGGLFDYFADYLCYIVAPWLLTCALLAPTPDLTLVVCAVPLFTGAIRYSRNGNLLRAESFEKLGFPGLLTVFYSLFVVCLVFLHIPPSGFARTAILVVIAGFSCMMVAPVRYPKLTRFKSVFGIVYVTLTVMPFLFTRPLAAIVLALVFAYVLISPFLVTQGFRRGVSGDRLRRQCDQG